MLELHHIKTIVPQEQGKKEVTWPFVALALATFLCETSLPCSAELDCDLCSLVRTSFNGSMPCGFGWLLPFIFWVLSYILAAL